MPKVTLSFKVDPELKKALERLAKDENRSLSNYVQTVLLNYLKEQGIKLKPSKKLKP
jgi:predicted transcriptional regulator